MRKELRWAFGGSLLLTIATLWWPQPAPKVVAAFEHSSSGDPQFAGVAAELDKPQPPLPSTLQPVVAEPARRDIFGAVTGAAPVVAAAPAPPPPVPVAAPPAGPTAPALTLRYLGRMVTPDGRPMVLLARGDVAVPVEAGMMLDEGYRVLRIGAEAIRLVYPPTGGEVDIPIPPAPPTP